MDNVDTEGLKFGEGQLFNSKTAPLRVFRTELNGRDQFGNRIFVSPIAAYLNREKEESRAALLVSPKGESFIRTHKGILKDIDLGLALLSKDTSKTPTYHPSNNSSGIQEIKYVDEGSQSIVYSLLTNGDKYALKVRNPSTKEYLSVSQPYINEMLQMQTLQKDLGEEIGKLGVIIPDYLFASGLVGFQEFVEGKNATVGEIDKIWRPLHELMFNYMTSQSGPLWRGVATDLLHFIEGGAIRPDNFIKRADGTFVWIDMFKYTPRWTLKEWVQMKADDGDETAKEQLKEFFKA